jgi:uncharacterized membrane protein YfcA
MEALILPIIIGIFSVIQSLLGVGLLVFGTPTLMMLGYDFQNTLAILLPASIVISTIQVWRSKGGDKKFYTDFSIYCLPFVLIGLVTVLVFNQNLDLSLFVGLMLLFSGAIRVSRELGKWLATVIEKYQKFYLVMME